MKTTESDVTELSPLGDAVRSVFYDNRKEPYYTEWQHLGPGEQRAQPPSRGAALVTGGRPEGTGEAIAAELALVHQYHVFLAERDGALGQQVSERIQQQGGIITCLEADVTCEADVARVMDQIAAATGQLDVLVNNASEVGDPARDNIFDLTGTEFRRLLDHTVTAPFLVSQAALRRFFMSQQRGVIVFLGSLSEEWGAWGQVGYSAGKAALGPVCKHILAVCGRHQIRAHVVRPAIIETRSRNALKRLSKDQRWYEKEGRLFPQGRVARPADIAALIGWLVSPQAACVGAELTADFGLKAVGLMHPAWSPLAFRESFVASVTQQEERQARKVA